jgi:hypothetical protein
MLQAVAGVLPLSPRVNQMELEDLEAVDLQWDLVMVIMV